MESLLSVGIDIGTTTTQLVFSRLTLENEGNAISVPHVVIRDRQVCYRSPIHLTPLLSDRVIDADGVREIAAEEYRRANVKPSEVDTGAVIITGETARKENARSVLQALSHFAGEFVVSTAGPDLESILAARGAGAQSASQEQPGLWMHFDIGGGTSNLAVFREGTLISTGCLDVGGNVVRLDKAGTIQWIAPKIQRLFPNLKIGDPGTEEVLQPVAEQMTRALEMAAGLQPEETKTALLVTHKLPKWTGTLQFVSFSGGVADAIWNGDTDWRQYGDIGVLLGRTIRRSRLFSRVTAVQLGETIRATVIGAGTQTTELSGSTVFYRGVHFPMQDLPVLRLETETVSSSQLVEGAGRFGDDRGNVQFALSLPGIRSPSFGQVQKLADQLLAGYRQLPEIFPVVALEQDMAKALGQALSQRGEAQVLCLDGIRAQDGDYMDVGAPVAGGAALPVIVKTLAFC